MSKSYNFLGDKIKRLRILNGYSQSEMGKELGLVKQTISTIEKGQRKVTTDELKKIGKFLRVPITVFFDDSSFETFEEGQKPEMKNRWNIEVPYIIDNAIDELDEHFEFIINSGFATPKTAAKQIENTIKLFQSYLKEFKEEKNLWKQ